jgi:hypothetical protein
MNASSGAQPSVVARKAIAVGARHVLFVLTVMLAGALFWIAPRPPMGDFPQHVAQVSLLRDLLAGNSPWQQLVYINYFTPYLTGYLLALGLSYVMPVLTAMKLMLMLAYYAYVWGCILLRRHMRADPRLDWLFVPGFFGLAWQFGFYTYLVAAPLALYFTLLAEQYGRRPHLSGGVAVFAAGVALFFSHGLVFLFACAMGAAFVAIHAKTMMRVIVRLTPYMLLAMVAAAYMLYARQHSLITWSGEVHSGPNLVWDWQTPWGWHRVYNFLLYVFASQMTDWYFLLAGMFMLAAPWIMGMRINWRSPTTLIPMTTMLVIWFLAPSDALDVDYLYQRFALYLLPAYALMFQRVELPRCPMSALHRHAVLTQWLMMLICWIFLGAIAIKEHRFAVENESFETLLSVTEPGQRALDLVYSPESPIIHNPYTYHSYPLWYQAEHKGFVDFNFAFALSEIVRFRPGRAPVAKPSMVVSARTFDWHAVQGSKYRYFFVRDVKPLPPGMFKNDECPVTLLKTAGDWSLFERGACTR